MLPKCYSLGKWDATPSPGGKKKRSEGIAAQEKPPKEDGGVLKHREAIQHVRIILYY